MKYRTLIENFVVLILVVLLAITVYMSYMVSLNGKMLTEMILILLIAVQLVSLTVLLRIYDKVGGKK